MVLVRSSSDEDGADDYAAVVDFRGNPADKSTTGGWLSAGLILVTELAERVCVMGISMNLVTYLVGELHLSTSRSATIVNNFMGTLNLLALLAGFLADARLGRYVTVAISATITATGVSLLSVATAVPSMKPPACNDFRRQHHECVAASGRQLALLFAALYMTALGGGGIKANVSGFGSDQFDSGDPKQEKAMVFFFNRFYFCISLGSLFAVTVLVYLQDNVGRGWGYGISAAAMAVAVTVLLAGTPRYRYRPPEGSPLTVVWRVVLGAWRRRELAYPADARQLHGFHNAKVPHTKTFRCLDKAAILPCNTTPSEAAAAGQQPQPAATGVCSVTQVEEVKMILKLLPIWSTSILFWTVYSQMNTFSVEQATFMDRRLSRDSSFSIPAGSFSFFLFATILLFTSLNERLLVPAARRFTHNPKGITSLQRVGVGLAFSIVAMFAAGAVERRRRELAAGQHVMSAFWLVPQFFLVGAGEAFAYVGQLEFFIREAPERMKSMSTGLFLTTLAMGFFVSSLLVSLVDTATNQAWIKNNLNKGRLDYFYWMLAVLGVVNFVAFLLFARCHRYKVQQYYVDKEAGEEEMKGWKYDQTSEEEKKAEIPV